MSDDEHRDKSLPLVRVIPAVTVFIALLAGTIGTSVALFVVGLPLLGVLASVFTVCYSAWQFETLGRVREHALLLGNRRPAPERRWVWVAAGHTAQAVLAVLFVALTTPFPVGLVLCPVLAAGLTLYLITAPPTMEHLIAEHELSLRRRRLHKLAHGTPR